jgi:HlyD family secretion protein
VTELALPDWRRPALAGYAIIAIAFGGLGLWAATAQLASGIVAPATLGIESNRKTVQHLEGGIIREILVREGDAVKKGQVLFRLDSVPAGSNDQMLRHELAAARALEARLLAERDRRPAIAWPKDLLAGRSDPVVAHAIDDQQSQFLNRRRALTAQSEVLETKIKEIRTGIEGIGIERQSTGSQLGYIKQELSAVAELREKNLVPLPRLLALQREKTRLEGALGKLVSDQASSQDSIQETELQIHQLHEKFAEQVAGELLTVRQKIAELHQKLAVAADVLQRVAIAAPVAGTVQNLQVFTTGQVIQPGEKLLDIVPARDALVVEAHFAPADIDGVYQGQKAEIRFPAFHDRTIPVIEGVLQKLSRDRLVDPATKEPYFLGLVAVARTDIPPQLAQRLRAGMPAEVIVSAGRRTLLDYLVSPLAETLRKAFVQR